MKSDPDCLRPGPLGEDVVPNQWFYVGPWPRLVPGCKSGPGGIGGFPDVSWVLSSIPCSTEYTH